MISEDKDKRTGITSFVLHIIAMILMLCDHLWGTFLTKYDILTCIGRMSFPLFASMLVEGFRHTSNRKKYVSRLFVFAVISEIPFNLMMASRLINPFHQNVLWSFLLGIVLMSIYDRIKENKHVLGRLGGYAIVTVIFYLLGIVTFVDYYGYGILMIALFYFTEIQMSQSVFCKMLNMAIQIAGMYWINCGMMKGLLLTFTIMGIPFKFYQQGFALLSLPLIWLYNGKQGYYNRGIKYFYYLFYPVHIAVLGVLITIL